MPELQSITPPPLTAPRRSLLVTAQTLDDGADWIRGYTFVPERCGVTGSGVVPVRCGAATDLSGAASLPDPYEAEPFAIWAADQCSTLGRDRDYVGRATRALAAVESYRFAHEVWSGSLAAANSQPNNSLAALATSVVGSPIEFAQAVQVVEQAALNANAGRRVMLHMPPIGIANLALGSNVDPTDPTSVWRAGNDYIVDQAGVLVTRLGNVVAVDAGYPATGPAGQTTHVWIYASPLIQARLGPVETIGTETDQIDRDVNTRRVVGYRFASFQYADCPIGAVFAQETSLLRIPGLHPNP